ncbi:hypothetical protein MKW98_005419 [Papaver atlanticum]|uniref:Uncharacterized protein n=1 Tax=Papaver atlanticum TaxID=357466 RepID=A0AAD4RWP9_9MAGN|nr:hypothetical protein MKW98_005419 [Papaver atlanticum]
MNKIKRRNFGETSQQLNNLQSELMLVNWIGVAGPVAKTDSYPREAPDLLAKFKVKMMLVNRIGVEKKAETANKRDLWPLLSRADLGIEMVVVVGKLGEFGSCKDSRLQQDENGTSAVRLGAEMGSVVRI